MQDVGGGHCHAPCTTGGQTRPATWQFRAPLQSNGVILCSVGPKQHNILHFGALLLVIITFALGQGAKNTPLAATRAQMGAPPSSWGHGGERQKMALTRLEVT